MREPVTDYRKLRFSNITSKEYRHLFLLLGWVAYFAAYFLTENLIPESACHVIHSAVDDLVPFIPGFVLVYVSWYVLVFASLLYFLLYDIKSFKYLQTYIIWTQAIAVIIYIVYPSVQYLRPENLEITGFFTWVLNIIYTADTPTGVCPSLHVGYSIGIASAWLEKKDAPLWAKIFVTVMVILICISVMFVKQHSFLDVIAALVMCAVIKFGFMIFDRIKKKKE